MEPADCSGEQYTETNESTSVEHPLHVLLTEQVG
jgi:hypothetical protein